MTEKVAVIAVISSKKIRDWDGDLIEPGFVFSSVDEFIRNHDFRNFPVKNFYSYLCYRLK